MISSERGRSAVLALALLLTALALVQAVHRARQGRSALIEWTPQIEALARGEDVYGLDPASGREGFPAPPVAALALWPFASLGEVQGAVAWAAFKVALAWFLFSAAFRLAEEGGRPLPTWARLLAIALSARVLLSDVAHGNVNIAVGATVVAAALAWSSGRDLRAGLWIGLGAALKLTPALGLLWFAWKRSWKGLLGTVLGSAFFFLLVPGLFLGFERALALDLAWWRQMAEPYLAGTRLGPTQTEHVNQSLLGVLARLATDCVAIPARPPEIQGDVRVHFLSLGRAQIRLLHLACSAAVLAFAAWSLGAARSARSGRRTLGEFALLALAMVFLSERSWKQHYVLLLLSITFLLHSLADPGAGRRPLALAALAASAALHGLTGSGVLGGYRSDLAEAYGAWLLGGLALYAACGVLLRRPRRSPAPPGARCR